MNTEIGVFLSLGVLLIANLIILALNLKLYTEFFKQLKK